MKKAREIEKRIYKDKLTDYKIKLKMYQDDPRNKVDNPSGVSGMKDRSPKKPVSLVGNYEKSLNYIDKYSNMSKEERSKPSNKNQYQEAKNYVAFIAKQTSHKNMNRNNRSLMKNARVEKDGVDLYADER